MAENSGTDMPDRATGPTYKSLFLAACALIGSTFGWWFTNFVADYNALVAKVAALEVRDTETRWTFRINAEKLGTYDERLKALEQEHDRRNGIGRGKP